MKISVISPVYNVEEYLCDCIESVLHQTYNNFELILVNDDSTDGSGAICDQYSLRYPKYVKTIHKKNGGPLQARLTGIQESSGDVLVFLDADDCLREDALVQIAGKFHENACDMVLFNAETCAEFSSLQITHSLKNGQIFDENFKNELYEKVIQGRIPNSVCLKAIQADCAYFPPSYKEYTMRHGEDLLLSVCFMTNCKRIVYLNEGLYFYRDRPGSAIHSFNVQRKESIKTVHTELEKYIDKWGMPELKPLHNARKVKGWIANLKLLINNRKCMDEDQFKEELISMSKDPYFCNAYKSMDKRQLSFVDRIFAYVLYNKQYCLISMFYDGLQILKKVKAKRYYDR